MKSATKGALIVGGFVLGGAGLIWLSTELAKGGTPPPPPPPPPPEGRANLYGRVTDAVNGGGIPDATVVITAPDSTYTSVPTDTQGNFAFLDIPVLEMDWQVLKDGFTSAAGTVVLVEGNNQLNVALVPEGPPPPDGSITFGTLVASSPYPQPDAPAFGTVDLACPITNHDQGGVFAIELWERELYVPTGVWYGPTLLGTFSVQFATGQVVAWSFSGAHPPPHIYLNRNYHYEWWLAWEGAESNRVTANW